jgi:hypothetical protein
MIDDTKTDDTKNEPAAESGATDDAARMTEFLTSEPAFEVASPLIDPPLEITRSMLRLLNMVDETVIVNDRRS